MFECNVFMMEKKNILYKYCRTCLCDHLHKVVNFVIRSADFSSLDFTRICMNYFSINWSLLDTTGLNILSRLFLQTSMNPVICEENFIFLSLPCNCTVLSHYRKCLSSHRIVWCAWSCMSEEESNLWITCRLNKDVFFTTIVFRLFHAKNLFNPIMCGHITSELRVIGHACLRDASFCSLKLMSQTFVVFLPDVQEEEPRPCLKKSKRDENGKSLSRMLKLNNNNISDLTDLPAIIELKFASPENLASIDLSHNELTKIDSVSGTTSYNLFD